MTSSVLEVGKPYPGPIPNQNISLFEFSKEGPELRLFFSSVSDEMVDSVRHDDCHLGLIRSDDVAVIPWKIGEHLRGDCQFHVFLYPPETRPTTEILSKDAHYEVQIVLVDRDAGQVRALRTVALSSWFSKILNEVVAWQLGNHIEREAYDAQVSIYQTHYPTVDDAIRAAEVFEKV
jgi:hypothetical protein